MIHVKKLTEKPLKHLHKYREILERGPRKKTGEIVPSFARPKYR